jgi:hypothetical protein
VHFTVEQTLPGTIDAIIAALLDPAFVTGLGALANLGPPEVLEQRRDGDLVVQRVRYRFTGSLSPAVTRVIDPRKVTWVDETTYDLRARRASFHIVPDHYAGKLRCSGTHAFTAHGDATVRTIETELTVKVPLVGRAVERAIVSGLQDHLDAESDLLAKWLENNG